MLAVYLAKASIFAVWLAVTELEDIDDDKRDEARHIIGCALVSLSALVTFAIP